MFLRSRLASIKFSILLLTLSSFASAQSQIPAQIDPDSACKPYLRAVAYFDHPSSVENRFGTGFLFSRDGLVVTAAHVVIDKNTNKYRQDITAILPSFYRGRHVDALWLPATPLVSVQEALKHDVAVLKVDGHNADGSELAHLELDEDGAVRAGDEVLIVGFPGGRMKCEIRQVLRVLQ